MKGRQLPACRTDRFARPLGTTWHDAADHTWLDTPGFRHTLSGHAVVLDTPPTDLRPWLARWQAIHGQAGVDHAVITWEGRRRVEVEGIPEGADHYRLFTLMYDQPIQRRPGPGLLRPLGLEDHTAAVDLGELCGDDRTYLEWAVRGWIERATGGSGVLWGCFVDEALLGVCGLFHDEREARTQWIATHPDHRKQGVCTSLLTHALQTHQDHHPGIVYTVVERGCDAERLYRALGYRQVTTLDEVIVPLPLIA